MVGRNKLNCAFSLIEVIFVISIISLLLSIVLPTFSGTKTSANKLHDMANLRQYAAAWSEFVVTRNYGTLGNISTDSAKEVSEILAGLRTENSIVKFYPELSIINDPKVYISQKDVYASQIKNPIIASNIEDNKNMNAFGDGNIMFSYCILFGQITNLNNLNTLPIAFTRGLRTDGTWDATYGLYGSTGGYIIFGDGHISWFDNSNTKFLKYDQSGYSVNILDAIPKTAKFSCVNAENSDISSADSKIIFNNIGTI